LTSCLTGLDKSVLEIKTKNISCHTADFKPVTQEVNSTVILPPLVFPEYAMISMTVAHSMKNSMWVKVRGLNHPWQPDFDYLANCQWVNCHPAKRRVAKLT
jgi:hypothetical protein